MRSFARWHPLIRLNVMIIGFFGLTQFCLIVLLVLFIPPVIDARTASFLFSAPSIWCMMSAFGLLYLSWNAFRMSKYHPTLRQLGLIWVGPVLMMVLVWIWFPTFRAALNWRADWDFQHSRSALLSACDRILEDGIDSNLLGTNESIGRFNRVDISLHDAAVWFDVGDVGGEVGYVCITVGADAPVDDRYRFRRKDDRFFYFQEVQDSDETD